MQNSNLITLDPPGVWIAVADPNITADLVTPESLSIEMATQDDFQLLRIIGNLKFSNVKFPDQTFFTFNPPAQLQVRFTPSDLNRAQRRGKPLALAYWTGDHWERFPPGNVPATDEAPATDGYAYFLIREIGDPPIAWGT